MLPFTVRFRAGLSVSEQVLYAVRKAIATGQLRPGDAFPSVRALSQELRINPNTAHKVVAALVADGLLEVRPGVGTQHQAVIDGLQCQNGNCTAAIRETHVSLLLAPSADRVVREMLFFRVNPDVLYILRNRSRGEAFWPQHGTTFGFGWITRSRRDETTMVAAFRSSLAPGPSLPRLDGDWIAGADLVRIEATPVRDVMTQVEVPDFVIDSGSESSAGAGA